MPTVLAPLRAAALLALALLSLLAFGQIAAHAQAPAAGQLLISEFRYRGPAVDTDDYVEIYNNTDSPITVADGVGMGFGVFASNLLLPYCVIPNGTVIPAKGHFLCAGSTYSLANYGGTGRAAPNVTTAVDLPDNAGLALYSSNTIISGTRLDSAGPSSELNPLFKEGTGFPTISAVNAEYALLRKLTTGRPQDTDNNETDFMVVETLGASMCTSTLNFQCQRLGAPGPENLASPLMRSAATEIASRFIDPCVSSSQSPNRARDATPLIGASMGYLDIRRRFVNQTGQQVTRLRFRVIDITTSPRESSSTADLRAFSSPDLSVTVSAACGGATIPVKGTTLETLPSPTIGGGFNSSLAAGTITTGAPLNHGASIDLNFRLAVEQLGSFRFFVVVEALP